MHTTVAPRYDKMLQQNVIQQNATEIGPVVRVYSQL